MLETARRVLSAVGNVSLEVEEEFEGLCSLEEVTSLGPVVERVFRALVTEEEWNELEACAANIASGNEARIRTARLKRQQRWLKEGADRVVVDLAVRDEEEQQEQAALAAQSVETVQLFLGAAGLIGQTALRPVEVLVGDVQQSESPRGVEEEEENEEEGEEVQEESVEQEVVPERAKRGRPKTARAVEEEERGASYSRRKKSPRKKAKGVVREHSDVEKEKVSEESNNDDDVEGKEDTLGDFQKLFAQAKEDAKSLRQLLASVNVGSVQSLRFLNVSPPDVNLATEAQGAELMKDASRLKNVLEEGAQSGALAFSKENTKDDNRLIEKLGAMLSWWRIVRQALALAGILAHLKGVKRIGGQKKRLGARYEQTVSKVLESSVVGYSQAKKYARIGRLVQAFPQLLYQTQVTSIAQWMALVKLASNEEALVDLFPRLLGEEDLAFWREPVKAPDVPSVMQSSVEQDEEGDLLCRHCDEQGAIFSCRACGLGFHEPCAGYPEKSLCSRILLSRPATGRAGVAPTIEFHVELYCGDCLREKEIDSGHVLGGLSDQMAVAEFLNQRDCPFILSRVPKDGCCIFRILADFAGNVLEVTWSNETFFKKISEEAVKSIEEARKETGVADLDAEPLKAFRKLARETGRVGMLKRGLWRELETQHVLKAYVKLFSGRVRICSYQNDKGKLRQTDEYFHGTANAKVQELHVLHWNSLDHYDELVRR